MFTSFDENKFRQAINAYTPENPEGTKTTPTVSIDAAIKATYISNEAVEDINRLQPFGVDNPAPVFATKAIKIHRISTMSDNKHLRMTLLKDGKYLDTVGFGMGEYYNYFKEGDFVDVAFGLSINDYKGFHNVQLILKDIKLSEVNN